LRIALATFEAPESPDADAPPLTEALAELGAEAEQPVWSDPAVDWSRFDLVQLAHTWDYHRRLGEFREWLHRVEVETRLENPRELVEWNLDKRYLDELADLEVPTVPTIWAEPGEEADAAGEARRRGWERVIVKPVVDLGAHRLRRVAPDQVQDALEEIGEPSMVQPYLTSLERSGELSLVFFRGELSHSILKKPREGDFRIQEEWGGTYRSVDPPDSAMEAADRVMALLASGEAGPDGLPGTPPLYGRTDLVAGPDGELCLMEVELIEPSFYFDVAGPETAARFARELVGAAA
jgi:hypothetical protein